MRRRVRCWEGMSDGTTKVYVHIRDYGSGTYEQDDSDYVLYDDELWERLLVAQAALQAVEHEVHLKLVDEPLDAVEIECGIEHRKMLDHVDGRKFDVEKWHALEDRLVAHAIERGK